MDTKYNVLSYQFIDDHRCFRPLSDVSNVEFGPEEAEIKEQQLRSELTHLFKSYGWEGDGEINVVFIPPCFTGDDDGWCREIYHVKQSNNGISWLAIPTDITLQISEGLGLGPIG